MENKVIRWHKVLEIYRETMTELEGFKITYTEYPNSIVLEIDYIGMLYKVRLDLDAEFYKRQVKLDAQYIKQFLIDGGQKLGLD